MIARYSRDVVTLLGVANSTLRKYCQTLESAGHRFQKDTQNRRTFTDDDIILLKRLAEFSASGIRLEDAALDLVNRQQQDETKTNDIESADYIEPSNDMPDEVNQLYTEASLVVNHSPRSSAALLRLAIEKLIPLLEGYNIQKRNLNTMIDDLVKTGIPKHIQQGLDAIRVYGNERIYSSATIDLNDKLEDAIFLFELLDLTVYELITRRKKIASLLKKLPQEKLVDDPNLYS
ncbi:DUF4145 domain-containing protein [Bacillus sp. UNC438CL73TsuS30]|uniref:DUF4145 domain-containing protein n=1 Tax=Bacillus sp. UNC438CL73TsuS30 TaxID=1340434 RepID=UPI000689C668|nr:DUF4145 domain-containing protein [Bacillus sp. UNC438CL73TsuS30]